MLAGGPPGVFGFLAGSGGAGTRSRCLAGLSQGGECEGNGVADGLSEGAPLETVRSRDLLAGHHRDRFLLQIDERLA